MVDRTGYNQFDTVTVVVSKRAQGLFHYIMSSRSITRFINTDKQPGLMSDAICIRM